MSRFLSFSFRCYFCSHDILISMEKKKVSLVKKSTKKLTLEDQIDSLARIVVSGFERIDKQFEKIDSRFEKIDSRFGRVDSRFDELESRLDSIGQEQKDHSVRFDRIEKRQIGTLTTLDETVHRNEFKILIKRVDALERKK